MQFWSLRSGNESTVDYEQARKLQLKLVDLRAQDLIPDTVLFLEHPPVITRGRGLQFDPSADPGRPKQLPIPAMIPSSIGVAETERGGDLTYHEPGQLVIYPICKLDGSGFGPKRDIAGFLRKFEQLIIDQLAEWGVEAGARENATGVWVTRGGADSLLENRRASRLSTAGADADSTYLGKLASMGIAVRKWVTYHGIAINAVNAMDGFRWISPCGYSPETMIRLVDLVSQGTKLSRILSSDAGHWRETLEKAIAARMSMGQGVTVRIVDVVEALARDGVTD